MSRNRTLTAVLLIRNDVKENLFQTIKKHDSQDRDAGVEWSTFDWTTPTKRHFFVILQQFDQNNP